MFFIICGVVTAAGVALGVTGMKSMPKVLEEMQKVERVHGALDRLQSQPTNKACLEAEEAKIAIIMEDRERVFKRIIALCGYQPLVADVFPAGPPRARNEFRARYAESMNALMESLNFGGPATDADFRKAKDRIENEQALRREIGLDSGASQPTLPEPGPAFTPAGVVTRDGVRENADARAHLAKAQSIYIYAVHFDDEKLARKVASLEFEPNLRDTGTVDAPDLWDVWRAQVGYWIQKDIVEAIVALNREAADAVAKRGENPWVGTLPVKEIISLRLSDGYVLPMGEGEDVVGSGPGGFEPSLPPGSAETVFTGTGSNDWYDVMQVSIKLIMDQRDINRLIDKITRNSIHTLQRVSYVAVPPNKKMRGKIYGAAPVVNVILDFETVMLGEVFRPLIPDDICEFYDHLNCPERVEEDEGD